MTYAAGAISEHQCSAPESGGSRVIDYEVVRCPTCDENVAAAASVAPAEGADLVSCGPLARVRLSERSSQRSYQLSAHIERESWGDSSAGRAPAGHAGGPGFESL